MVFSECMAISSGRPTEPTVSQTPTHLVRCHHLFDAVERNTCSLDRETARSMVSTNHTRSPWSCPSSQDFVQFLYLCRSNRVRRVMHLCDTGIPSVSVDLARFCRDTKISEKWSISVRSRTPMSPLLRLQPSKATRICMSRTMRDAIVRAVYAPC